MSVINKIEDPELNSIILALKPKYIQPFVKTINLTNYTTDEIFNFDSNKAFFIKQMRFRHTSAIGNSMWFYDLNNIYICYQSVATTLNFNNIFPNLLISRISIFTNVPTFLQWQVIGYRLIFS